MDKICIIAEAGVNHNGDMQLAKQLVDIAAEAGADYVKFQTFKAEKIASASAEKAGYQASNTGGGGSQLDMLKRLELSESGHDELIQYCSTKNIAFLSTPFDLESIALLKAKGVTIGKIPSGEITNLPYLRRMASSFPRLILSTGMSDMQEIKAALAVLTGAGVRKEHITVLHCNTEYPTPMEDVHLRTMQTLADELGTRTGYSDHTQGIEVAIAAAALGAGVIEKHFTVSRELPGPDHKASLEPAELKAMISAIRNIEKALGRAEKKPTPSEMKNRDIARKSIVAATAIRAGENFSAENITVKRPGNGISPMNWDNVVGRKAKRDFKTDEQIEL